MSGHLRCVCLSLWKVKASGRGLFEVGRSGSNVEA